MRIAYMTIDEVNRASAAQMAGECGAFICAQAPKDSPPDDQFLAVLYDLDGLQRHERAELIARIVSSPSTCPRAVHGYDITDEEASALRRHGVAVSKRLHAGLVRSLCKAAQPSRATVPAEDDRTELTWVNVVN
jgi:nitrate reductase cytochrome c-type subunit